MFNSESYSITNAVPRSELISVGTVKAQDDLTADFGDTSATVFSKGSSHPPDYEEVCDIFPRAKCAPTQSVHELGTTLCITGKTQCAGDTLPIEISTRAAEKGGKPPIYIATPVRKREIAICDVDGSRTSNISSKKRRLRLQSITSRLSRPFSLPATHVFNRDTDEDTAVISRSVRLVALGAKKTEHQTTLVRRAAIMNRVRLNIRQSAVTRGHNSIWRMTRLAASSHGLQLVTDSTGAMFPSRLGQRVPGPIMPRLWRSHTTASAPVRSSISVSDIQPKGPDKSEQQLQPHPTIHPNAMLPITSIMTTLAEADEDGASFPNADLDSRYADTSDDDVDGVYADFGVLFNGGVDSPNSAEEDKHYYEEYVNEFDGKIWSS